MKVFNISGKKEGSINNYNDFWNWFRSNAASFYEVIKSRSNPESVFFDKLSAKLVELHDGYYFLAGMLDTDTAELVFTPDGNIKNIVFVEELVQSAPAIPNWKFTALKPSTDIQNIGIQMNDYQFDGSNISFYANDHAYYPDEVDITLVYDDYKDEDKSTIENGVFIFLDHYLGELYSLTTIDRVGVIAKERAEKELVPIAKLKDYLIWREKEFVEKYSGLRYDTQNDKYAGLEAELDNGLPLIAMVNASLLEWDNKASHPWILRVELAYEGSNNGLPDRETFELLNEIEDQIMSELKDYEGYLNIGRETAGNLREVYFACKDFRLPSKVLYKLAGRYAHLLNIKYDIYKDKYWQSFERFRSK